MCYIAIENHHVLLVWENPLKKMSCSKAMLSVTRGSYFSGHNNSILIAETIVMPDMVNIGICYSKCTSYRKSFQNMLCQMRGPQ